MNTKLVLSACVAALALAGCSKTEEAASPDMAAPAAETAAEATAEAMPAAEAAGETMAEEMPAAETATPAE